MRLSADRSRKKSNDEKRADETALRNIDEASRPKIRQVANEASRAGAIQRA
jgi:hypothetical protein